jgi:hypothetical protein
LHQQSTARRSTVRRHQSTTIAAPRREARGNDWPLDLQRSVGNRATRSVILAQRNPEPAVAKVDPLTIRLKQPDYDEAKKIFTETPNWNALKKKYLDGADPSGPKTMGKLWAFRRRYIVELMQELKGEFTTLIAKSAGSTDLSSDYDITVSSPGGATDVDAIRAFNKHIAEEFGVQPGTLFDTNLYARDFGEITPSDEFADFMKPTPAVQTAANANQRGMEEDVTDVGALIKLRRYMDQTEWDTYVDDLVGKLDEKKQSAVRRRHDEADAAYQIAVSDLLATIGQGLNENESLATAQRENASRLATAEHDDSDSVLKQSNVLYLGRVEKIRKIEAQVGRMEEQKGGLDGFAKMDMTLGAIVNDLMDKPDLGLQTKIDAQKTQIKQLLSQAIFFAAEAYNSEGAIKHVVAGIQGGKLSDDEKQLPKEQQQQLLDEKRRKANAGLTLNHLQQSFNEQLGDFLKDYGHLAGATDGTFYVKSSKYVWRMLDAALIVKNRMGADFPEESLKKVLKGQTLEQFKASIDELYNARGNPEKWGANRETEAVNRLSALGIDSRADYKAILLALGSHLGSVMRNQMGDGVKGSEELSFFQNI